MLCLELFGFKNPGICRIPKFLTQHGKLDFPLCLRRLMLFARTILQACKPDMERSMLEGLNGSEDA
jgi:hypothetical protein